MSTASGLLGRQVQHVFIIDGWNAIGTGLSRASPPEIIKLDIRDAHEVERVLDDIKYRLRFTRGFEIKLTIFLGRKL